MPQSRGNVGGRVEKSEKCEIVRREADGVLRISDTINCIPPFKRAHSGTTSFAAQVPQAIQVQSVDVSAHPANSFVLDSVASVSIEVTYRADSRNAYFRGRDGKTSQPYGLGRTGKQFGPESWGQRATRRSERPTKRPKQLVHGLRGRDPPYSVASAPQRAPPNKLEGQTHH